MGSFAGFEPVDARVRARRAQALDRWLLSLLHKSLGDAPVRLRLWDGTEHAPRARPLASLLVRDRKTLIGMLLDPDLNVGEAYASGRLEVEGDLVAVNEAVFRALSHGGGYAMLPWWRFSGAGRHGLRASRDNIHHHYDIGNDFYRLWLDRQLVYTCAYFPTPTATLEEAQEAKMEYVCRKLDLRAGEKVVEAGCGWGSLALHMARRHGVTVRAFNISREQVRWARRRAEAEGLADLVDFVEDDYRNIHERCDAFVSVGMLEHVGLRNYRTLGAVIDRCLAPSGRGLLHFIGRNRLQPLNAWIRKRIFPGAYPPTLRQVMEEILEPWSFSVLDVENLRLHYARTLHHWLHRFEGAAEEVARMFDEPFVRAWRLYLAGSEAAFATGWMQLFQVTFARPDKDDVPWTRAHLYRSTGR